MRKTSEMGRLVSRMSQLPACIARPLINRFIRKNMPMAEMAGIAIERLESHQVCCTLKNRRLAKHHSDRVEAGILLLLAEVTSHLCIGINLPDHRQSRLVSVQMDSLALVAVRGDVQAKARVSDEQIMAMHIQPEGQLEMPLALVDDNQRTLAQVSLCWCWTTRD
jgi:acyl-coenzyme A thioesterase PaaI-like protein